MHTFEPRWAPPQERPQVGVHVDRYNMSHSILLRASCISAFSQSHDDESPRQRTLLRVGLLTTRVNYIHIYVYTCTHEYVFIFHHSHIHMYMYIHGDLGPGVHASFSLKAGRGLPLFLLKEKGGTAVS